MDRKLIMFGKERTDNVLERVLFVDPGLGGTGWAYFPWIQANATKKTLAAPTITGVLTAPTNEKWDNRAWSYCAQFAGIINSCEPETVVLEYPELFSGDAKSQASAARGDLFKLTFLIGGLAQVAREATGKLPILVLPKEWKGQLPKPVVINRIKKQLGIDCQDHEGDAVAMGLAAQGRLE